MEANRQPDIAHLRRVAEITPPPASVPLWPAFAELISHVAINSIG